MHECLSVCFGLNNIHPMIPIMHKSCSVLIWDLPYPSNVTDTGYFEHSRDHGSESISSLQELKIMRKSTNQISS